MATSMHPFPIALNAERLRTLQYIHNALMNVRGTSPYPELLRKALHATDGEYSVVFHGMINTLGRQFPTLKNELVAHPQWVYTMFSKMAAATDIDGLARWGPTVNRGTVKSQLAQMESWLRRTVFRQPLNTLVSYFERYTNGGDTEHFEALLDALCQKFPSLQPKLRSSPDWLYALYEKVWKERQKANRAAFAVRTIHPASRQPMMRQISRLLRASRPNTPNKAALPCRSVVVVPQSNNRGTCWFNALLMAFFFSDRMRAASKRALERAHTLHDGMHVNIKSGKYPEAEADVDLLQRLASLVMLYKQPSNYADKAFNQGLRPEDILASFQKRYPDKMPADVYAGGGYVSAYAAGVLARAIGLKMVVVNPRYTREGMLQLKYSRLSAWLRKASISITTTMPNFKFYNSSESVRLFGSTLSVADVICITKMENNAFRAPPGVQDRITITAGDKTPDNVYTWFCVAGKKYVLDSAVVNCTNKSHSVAGVTCNGHRMMYNGWKGTRGKACPLAEIDWLRDTAYITADNCNWATPSPNACVVSITHDRTNLFYVNAAIHAR